MTDEKIIQLYFNRDEKAIEETSIKYGSYCDKIANNILRNRQDSEECLNDTWMQTWDSIPPTHPVHFNLFLDNYFFDRLSDDGLSDESRFYNG